MWFMQMLTALMKFNLDPILPNSAFTPFPIFFVKLQSLYITKKYTYFAKANQPTLTGSNRYIMSLIGLAPESIFK